MSKIPFGLLLLLVVVVGLGWGAAFAAGAAYGRLSGAVHTTTAALGAGASAAPAADATSGSSGGAGRFASGAASEDARAAVQRGTIGIVEQASADRLAVRGPAGRVTVLLRPDTVVRRAAEASAADVREGSVVLVSGQRVSNGEVEAVGVIVLPPEFAAGDRSAGERRRPESQRP